MAWRYKLWARRVLLVYLCLPIIPWLVIQGCCTALCMRAGGLSWLWADRVGCVFATCILTTALWRLCMYVCRSYDTPFEQYSPPLSTNITITYVINDSICFNIWSICYAWCSVCICTVLCIAQCLVYVHANCFATAFYLCFIASCAVSFMW